MKKTCCLFLFFLSQLVLANAQDLPEFSNNGHEEWYYIRFKLGDAVVQDMGEGSNIKTEHLVIGNASQLWKIVGNINKCEIISKNGRHIYYNSDTYKGSSRFVTSKYHTGNMKLYKTESTLAPAWELQNNTIAGMSMNPYYGAGFDKELDEWYQNDESNPFEFVSEQQALAFDTLPTIRTEYKYIGNTTYSPLNKMTLWYLSPVTAQICDNSWMDYALPIGNGQLGAMIYGGINRDIIQFNEKTVWTGSSTYRGSYQNFGHLYIDDLSDAFSTISPAKAAINYYRYLDLSNATAATSWSSSDGKTTFTREYIASFPDQCIAIHLKTSTPGTINNHFFLYNAHENAPHYTAGEGNFSGKLTTVSYNARMKVIPIGGTMTTDSTGIYVHDADEVTVILAGGTDFDPTSLTYLNATATLGDTISKRVNQVANEGWKTLYLHHLKDYQQLYNRVALNLDGSDNKYNTLRMINTYATNNSDKAYRIMEELYFQYGRYLLISSSRGIDAPSNLQGIWCNTNTPDWQSDYHGNINVEMNYWPAEVTNLSETHDKFLNYVYNMAVVHPLWQKYAKTRCGQTTGWDCFTDNNLFGQSPCWHDNYCEAGAWYCSHLWQHYRYTQNKDFLKKKALPVMLSCVKFWMERVIKASDEQYECPNEWSPEHGPKENATAHSQQIVWQLFANTLSAIETLGPTEAGVTDSYVAQVKEKFNKLDNGLHKEEYKGTYGSTRFSVSTGDSILREWKYTDFATGNGTESDHRHLSHLMALYPFNAIPCSSIYFDAAVNSLKLRGIQSQGWSMGWKINLWARALQGDSCAAIFKLALKHSSYYVLNMSASAGGVYYNMLDSHSPFQIDGNFGVCAGMAEMLLQSQNDTIALLPALPAIWPKGEVSGLRAVNNFEVSESWAEMKLKHVIIKSFSGKTCLLAYKKISNVSITNDMGNKVNYTKMNSDHIAFDTDKGGIYTIIPDAMPDAITILKTDGKINIGIQSHKLIVNGGTAELIQIYNTAGMMITSSKGNTILLPKIARKTEIIVKVYMNNGATTMQKILLRQ